MAAGLLFDPLILFGPLLANVPAANTRQDDFFEWR